MHSEPALSRYFGEYVNSKRSDQQTKPYSLIRNLLWPFIQQYPVIRWSVRKDSDCVMGAQAYLGFCFPHMPEGIFSLSSSQVADVKNTIHNGTVTSTKCNEIIFCETETQTYYGSTVLPEINCYGRKGVKTGITTIRSTHSLHCQQKWR